MKALVKKYKSPGLWMEEVDLPEIHADEVLIKTHKTAICGTDVHIYHWDEWAQKTIPVPLIIGHEFMGEIVEMGSGVKGLKKGSRVSGEGHITCNRCPLCLKGKKHLCMNQRGLGVKRPGCFAEYFSLPAENVFELPSFITDEVAAVLDPFGNAVHAALSFNLTGEDVLITGAGPIGIMAAAVARKAGARTVIITDPNEYRLALAKKMGAIRVVNINKDSLKKAMEEESIEAGFTVCLEMSGNPKALQAMIETTQPGAHIALLGILPSSCLVDWDLIIFKMLNIKGIYGREIFSTWFQMVHLLESGLDLQPIITHRFSAEDFELGFEAMSKGQSGKVILNWA